MFRTVPLSNIRSFSLCTQQWCMCWQFCWQFTSSRPVSTYTIAVCTVKNSMLIKIPPDATVCRYLFTAKSLYMFRVSQHPSSGVLKTVTATSSTATSLQRGLITPRWREVAVPVLWPVPEFAVTVFSTPDDGCCDTRNM